MKKIIKDNFEIEYSEDEVVSEKYLNEALSLATKVIDNNVLEKIDDSWGEEGYEFNIPTEKFLVYAKRMKEKYPELSFEELWAKIEDINDIYTPVFSAEEIAQHKSTLKELFDNPIKDSEKLYRVFHFSYKRGRYFTDIDEVSLEFAEKIFAETVESLKHFNENISFKDEFIVFLAEDDHSGYPGDNVLKIATVKKNGKVINDVEKEVSTTETEDVMVKDIPTNAPEEKTDITFTEKLRGGKNALTYGMIEQALKDINKDDGKTFGAYIDVVIESLKDDIANAKYIVSGEMKSTRKQLLENYIKIERLVQKAGLKDKLEIMKPLIDELSEKLDLNYWKPPKFKKSEMKSAARELRNAHRFDSIITKSLKPVFLCSKADLTASYNDAKQGKLPKVFEGNLEKVSRDMEADYDRINQGRDHYLEDPRIVQIIPEIIDLYETALKYAEDLGYEEYAKPFRFMLETIKKGWGIN